MHLTKRKSALVAGVSLILMAVAAGYAYGYVYSALIVKGNSQETYGNLNSSLDVFIGGIVGWWLIFVLDIIVAWALHEFLKESNAGISKMTALLRVVYALVLGAAITQLMAVVSLVNEQAEVTSIMERLKSFEALWSNGLIIFGVHLLGLGILSIKSANISNIFGGLFLFAGLCYFGIHLATAMAPAYKVQISTIEMMLSLPMAIAEIGFAFWLIVKGGKSTSLSTAAKN
jgi:hypothetical protein